MNCATEVPGAAAGDPLPVELNLGCGLRRRDGCVNVDRLERVRPDLVWDLDRYPYPLPGSHFRVVYASDLVEHIEDVMRFMVEVHRLLAPGGVVEITTPHFSCANAFTDPTHRHFLGYFSFDCFTSSSESNFYADERFGIEHRQIAFHPSPANRIVAWWANRHPALYERRFAWMFPAWFLTFRLRAVK